MPPNIRDFQKALEQLFEVAQKTGKSYLDIQAAQLHTIVGNHRRGKDRMSLCCGVMKANMKPDDEILEQPLNEYGPNLVIRYKLPR